MVLLKNFKNIFKIPELTQRLLFTLGVLIIFRLGSYIPVAGVNIAQLAEYMARQSGGVAGLLKYLDIFSGGQMSRCTLFALGIGPYITASIIMQVLSMGVCSTLSSFRKMANTVENRSISTRGILHCFWRLGTVADC